MIVYSNGYNHTANATHVRTCVCVAEVINGWTHVLSDAIAAQPKLPRWCLLLQTVAGYQCTRYLKQLVLLALIDYFLYVCVHVCEPTTGC